MIEMLREKVTNAGNKLAKNLVYIQAGLPWRERKDPYRVFLAEMLLVRTRADMVAQYFESIFEKYPEINKLAAANENELRSALYSLGLSKRVPFIIRAARFVCNKFEGDIPRDIETLMQIPGVGNYTACAISVFAYNKKLVPADVNILRFVSRLIGLPMSNKTKGSKELTELALMLSEEYTGLKPEILLDFTRLICKPRKPSCDGCCLFNQCAYWRALDGINLN